MTRALDIASGGLFSFAANYTLDGVTVRLAFRWYPRLNKWAVLVADADGTKRSGLLVIEAGATVPVSGVYPGTLRWQGPEVYRFADLGDRLRLLYEPAA